MSERKSERMDRMFERSLGCEEVEVFGLLGGMIDGGVGGVGAGGEVEIY